jgi:tripeptidyl-peptidase-1
MVQLSFLLFGLLLAVARALPSNHSHVLHERRDNTHPRWTRRGRLHPERVLPMRFYLTQNNVDSAEDFLLDV